MWWILSLILLGALIFLLIKYNGKMNDKGNGFLGVILVILPILMITV